MSIHHTNDIHSDLEVLKDLFTLFKKPPDLGPCLEMCQHFACLFHVHVFVQVRSIQ